ncbi:hypothetical protein PHYSODRAFT_512734 [Phytophthora sojae]|uniref:Uncharacterized protein n=1 Tax=Phytophthora sojae (strain P6497) TaxID=1094619 RepID=G4ZRI4_PHYSP|nr:hypothetical protein PHYSODRAFT_512734 [Phytophthora sojae]EGZ14137.1 hypothetical protein PHYSODRAFT_512734 [Phytophthora sojae]|eukprot:XP_009531566.1 hypothetical protein PHYSODRAFT_512734 [Phytophthora sojae]
MTNAASRQQAKNAKAATAAAPAKSASATAVKVTKMTAMVAATPTPASQSKPFALSDVTTWSVQRARQIRKADHERFVKFLSYFTAKDEAVAKLINSKAKSKRENVDQWVRSVLSPKTLACVQDTQETQQTLLSLITVSAALSKYGELELVRRNMGSATIASKAQQSKQQTQHSVGASFVLRLVLGLAPEKRAACQTLREILSLDNNGRLMLAPTTKALKPIFGKTNPADWSKVNQYKLKHMVKQAQSDKFQEAMLQLGGQHLYDAIRTQLKQIGGAWDASKDKPALQAKNARPRSNSTEKSVKSQKEAERRKEQPAKHATQGQIQAAKKTQAPPPTPVKVTKDTLPKNKVQNKSSTPTKNTYHINNAVPVKGVSLMGAWAGPVPASVVLGRPGAIVSSAPTMSARAGNGGRAILSRAF